MTGTEICRFAESLAESRFGTIRVPPRNKKDSCESFFACQNRKVESIIHRIFGHES